MNSLETEIARFIMDKGRIPVAWQEAFDSSQVVSSTHCLQLQMLEHTVEPVNVLSTYVGCSWSCLASLVWQVR